MTGDRRLDVVLQITPDRFAQLFSDDTAARLRELASVTGPFDATTVRTLSPAIAQADALFLPGGMHVPRAVLEGAPHLRWIADCSGGPPHLDYHYTLSRGIHVTDCRRAFAPAVGEMALALYLAVMRDVVVHDRALHTPDQPEGKGKDLNHEASGRTVGLVGYGGIARALHSFLAPFRPHLLIHDPFVTAEDIRAAGAEPVSLHDLLRRSEAIFLMAVPTVENRALIGPAELDLIRPDAVLLVISRSHLVDEAALIERLRAGKFRAAMDVFDIEPLPPNHSYRSLPNVVLTPHRAGGTLGSYRRIGDALVEDLALVSQGQPPTHNSPVTLAAARLQNRLATS